MACLLHRLDTLLLLIAIVAPCRILDARKHRIELDRLLYHSQMTVTSDVPSTSNRLLSSAPLSAYGLSSNKVQVVPSALISNYAPQTQ